MKPRFLHQALYAVALGSMALFSGCSRQNTAHSAPYVTTIAAPPVVPPAPTIEAPVAATPGTNAETPGMPVITTVSVPPLIISNPPAPAIANEAVPPNLRLSKPLNEVVQLAQSGVEESIILTFVTNTTSLFTLGAEEIVYLNDLGLSSNVITAMMQRDVSLKQAWAKAGMPAPTMPVATQETVAAAPSYVSQPQPTTVVETQPVASDTYFYETLNPYGSWVEVEGYGRCWRPTVAVTVSDWQPYRDRGRWVYTDSGWFWVSDYSWGSVTFHYGRWFTHPRWGWCWWPDNVWAPSWVTWRYDNDHCGWAPLPPRSYYRSGVGFTYYNRNVGLDFDFGLSVGAFTFVPWNRFSDPHPYRYCLPRARSVAIYNQTTVINNVVVGNNNTIVNNGIGRDRVRHFTRTEVKPVQIREEKAPTGRLRQEHFERDGRTLVVRRPQPTPVAATPGLTPNIERRGSRTESERVDNDRRAPRQPAVVTTPTPAAPFKPVTPTTRTETTPLIDRSRRNDDNNSGRERDNRGTVVKIPETRLQPPTPAAPGTPVASPVVQAPPVNTGSSRESRNEAAPRNVETPMRRVESPTPARTPTPIFQKPVVVQTPAYTPSRPVVSGGAVELPTGSTRVERPQVEPNNALNVRSMPSRSETVRAYSPPANRNATVVSPAPEMSAPVAPRSQPEMSREQRPTFNNFNSRSSQRVEERSAPAFNPPAPRSSAVATPSPQPTYAPPTPAPRMEAPVAPRVEQRSEPRSAPVPRQDGENRSSNRGSRDR